MGRSTKEVFPNLGGFFPVLGSYLFSVTWNWWVMVRYISPLTGGSKKSKNRFSPSSFQEIIQLVFDPEPGFLKNQRTEFPELPVLYWLFRENRQSFNFFKNPGPEVL
jgi:hypothetical protein